MPAIDWSQMDQTALIALGFLAGVLTLTGGLFGWLFLQMGKRPKR